MDPFEIEIEKASIEEVLKAAKDKLKLDEGNKLLKTVLLKNTIRFTKKELKKIEYIEKTLFSNVDYI